MNTLVDRASTTLRPRTALCFVAALLAGCSGTTQVNKAPTAPMATAPIESGAAKVMAEPAPEEVPVEAVNAKTAPEAGEKHVAPEDKRPRMGATGLFAYVFAKPAHEGLALGYIRMGTSVPLKSTQKIEGKGCGRGWYAVEPRGYVCLKNNTTLNLEDPYYKALHEVSPEKDATWYYRYAFSNGAPMYSRIPTKEEMAKEDFKFGKRGSFVQLDEWSAGHEELLMKEPIEATDPVPEWLSDGKRHIGGGNLSPSKLIWRKIPNGSMLAYAKAFEKDGRVWLLTPDLMIVPADRVRQIKRSSFHGVDLGNGVELPLAWNRTKAPKPKYKMEGGKLVAIANSFPSKTWVQISEDKTTQDGKTFFKVRGEEGVYVQEDDVTVSRAKPTLPSGVKPGQKWIEAKILTGTLTLYEDNKPVRATLFSPGKGGVPVPGNDNTKYATTGMGFYPIEWKDHVATMSNEKGEAKVLWFTDVPHIQYLRAPLAMHVAYWHEDFGNPKSAECVNISPEDGHFIFNWTDPQLPEGWGAIRPGGGAGLSTPVIITAK